MGCEMSGGGAGRVGIGADIRCVSQVVLMVVI